MVELFVNEVKTARVAVTNTSAKAFDFKGQLFIGLVAETGAKVNFHLNAGETREVSFSIAMPSVAGVYPVYLSIHTDGTLVKLYRAEDIAVISEMVLEISYSSKIDSCLKADVYCVLEDEMVGGVPGMLYPDITDEKIIYQPVGSKALILPAWGSWPVITWQYRGPYQAVLTPGVHHFDAATGKLDGVQLAELASVANKAKVRGRITSVASGNQVTSDRFSYIIGQAGVIEIDRYEDVPGYASIGAFLAPKMVFAGLSGWPFWNAAYGYPYIPADQQPVMVEVEVSWKYSLIDGQRYIYLAGENISLLPEYPLEAYEFSGSLSRGAIDPSLPYANQTIYYSVSGNVSPFSVYFDIGIPSPNLYGLAAGGYKRVGPGSGSVMGHSTAKVSMYAHPDPNAPTWEAGFWSKTLWNLVASVPV